MTLCYNCIYIKLYQALPCIKENESISRLRPKIDLPWFLTAIGWLRFTNFITMAVWIKNSGSSVEKTKVAAC